MTLSETGEQRADAGPELAPEYGRVGAVLCGLVALALVVLMVHTAMNVGEGGMAFEPPSPPIPLGTPAPDFVLPDLDGNQIRLADQQGQVVLVDFWATWCGSCKEELPHIETFHRQYGDAGLRVLALSTDTEDEAVQPFVDRNEYTFTVLHADEAVQGAYGVEGIPVVYLVDRQGRVRWHRVGFSSGGEEDIAREIEKLLDEPAEPATSSG